MLVPGDAPPAAAGGFSLLEVLVATTIVAVGVTALAQLTTLALHANLHARQATIAAVLAQQKMEELLPATAPGDLARSPAGTLDRNVEGYYDFVDRSGRALAGGPAPPPGSAYVRRWSIEPLPDSPGGVAVLQVLAADLATRRDSGLATPGMRLPGDARIVAATAGRVF